MNPEEFIEKHTSILVNLGSNIFLISVVLLLLDQLSILNVSSILNLNWLSFMGMSLGAFAFILWQENLSYTKREFYKKIIKYSFLFLLLLITINSLDFEFLRPFTHFYSANQTLFLYLAVIALGIIMLWQNRKLIDKTEQEKILEEKEEKKRDMNFARVHPKMNSIPILRYLLKQIYREGWWYILGLILILALFIFIKYPYMDLNFTGYHEMKYSAYVEPAKHMLDHNMLWNERKYIADPVLLVDGTYDTFGTYPLMEWGLYTTFKLFPNNSVEFNTRVFTAFIGTLLMISAYLFFKIFFSKKQTLLILFLLSINVIIQFLTYVTVVDNLIILFFFISLYFLVRGLKANDMRTIFLAGIIAGIGINLKYSLIIFLLPIALILIWFYEKISVIRRFNYLLFFLPNLILQTVIFRISIRYLPTNILLYSSIFIALIALQIILYLNIKKISFYSEKFIERYLNFKTFFLFITVPAIILIIALIKIEWIDALIKDGITDQYLIFNWQMYKTFFENYRNWLTDPIYYLSLIGLFGVIISKIRKIKLLFFGFLVSALTYLIVASKIIYFHEYYNHIIIITFVLLISNFVYLSYKSLDKFHLKFIFLILVLGLILPPNISNGKEMLSKQDEDVIDVANYLNAHMKEDEYFSGDVRSTISFYADRKMWKVGVQFRDNDILYQNFRKDSILGLNIGKLMKKYRTKYYVTFGKENFNKIVFYYLYNQDVKEEDTKFSFRTRKILCEVKDICYENEYQEKIEKSFQENVRPYLILEKQVGNYYVYRFY